MLFYPRVQQQRLWLITHFAYWKIGCRSSHSIGIEFIFTGIQKLSQFNTYLSCCLYCISLVKLRTVEGFISFEVFKLPSEVSFISTFQEPYVLATWLVHFPNTFHLSHAVKYVIKNTSLCIYQILNIQEFYWCFRWISTSMEGENCGYTVFYTLILCC